MTLPRHETAHVVRWDLFLADGRTLDLELDRQTGKFALCVVEYDGEADDWRVTYEYPAWASRTWARIAGACFMDGTPVVTPDPA